jgi:ABC-2 type transport system permease protein
MTRKVVGPDAATGHDLSHVPLRDPADTSGLLEVFRRRYLLRLMVRREIRARYIGSKFGLAWSYINPTVRFFTYYFVFGIILNRGAIPHFAIHLFAGMVLVHFFTETFNSGTRSIMSNKAVVQKMALPREMFPVASMLVSMYHTGPQLVVLVIACLGTGSFAPDLVGLCAALLGFAIVLVLGTAMGVMFSAVNVLFRDFTRVVQTLTNMIPFSVPMMYPYTMVSERFGDGIWHQLYLLNPVGEAVLLMQRAFWITTVSAQDVTDNHAAGAAFQPGVEANFPSHLFERGFIMLAVAIVFLVFAQRVFTRLDDRLPERL